MNTEQVFMIEQLLAQQAEVMNHTMQMLHMALGLAIVGCIFQVSCAIYWLIRDRRA